MARFEVTAAEEMYAEQRRVAKAVQGRRKPSVSSAGGLEGPFAVLLHAPGILDRMQHLGEYCRFSTGVHPRLRELAIIIAARHVGQPFEFRVHAMEAREFGLGDEIIDAIAARRRPADLPDEEAIVYDFCTEMFGEGRVSDAAFQRAETRFGRPALLELIATCGYYAALGMVLNISQWKPSVERVLPFPTIDD